MDKNQKKAKLEDLFSRLEQVRSELNEISQEMIYESQAYLKNHEALAFELKKTTSQELSEVIALVGRQIDEINEGRD